jgi:hypothetical protein
VFGPDTIRLKPYSAVYIYAVGDFFGGTFQYLVFSEDGLKESRSKAREARKSGRRYR